MGYTPNEFVKLINEEVGDKLIVKVENEENQPPHSLCYFDTVSVMNDNYTELLAQENNLESWFYLEDDLGHEYYSLNEDLGEYDEDYDYDDEEEDYGEL